MSGDPVDSLVVAVMALLAVVLVTLIQGILIFNILTSKLCVGG